MDKKMKLRDIIGYLDLTKELETNSPIQIGFTNGGGWDSYTEISTASPLLSAYYDWDITDMGAELSDDEDPIPVIRVLIRKPDQEAET